MHLGSYPSNIQSDIRENGHDNDQNSHNYKVSHTLSPLKNLERKNQQWRNESQFRLNLYDLSLFSQPDHYTKFPANCHYSLWICFASSLTGTCARPSGRIMPTVFSTIPSADRDIWARISADEPVIPLLGQSTASSYVRLD